MVYVNVRVNEKGQIVIPKVLRDAHGIKPGEDVVLKEKGDLLVIERKLNIDEFSKALADFPKWGKKVQIYSDKDYEEELMSR